MKRPARLIACLAVTCLAAACTVYKFRDVDGKALAAKGRRGRIMSVETTGGPVSFSESDPVEVKNGAILGCSREVCRVDPFSISELTTGKSGSYVVLTNGRRFRVAASRVAGKSIECEAVQSLVVPLDDVVKAKVRTTDAAASILGTLGAAIVVVGIAALDDALDDDNGDLGSHIADEVFSGLLDDVASGESGRRKSNRALLGTASSFRAAEETEFWAMEWTPVEARPGEDGKLHLQIANPSGVPRGTDEAKLIVVDHSPGLAVIPDVLGVLRDCPAPVPPDEAVDASGTDVRNVLSAKDGLLWRSPGVAPGAEAGAAPARDRLTLSFPRPKGARWAKLIINAANSSWRSEFAREVQAANAKPLGGQPPSGAVPPKKSPDVKAPPGAKPAPIYEEWEYGKLRVQLQTAYGWRTAQLIFAPGPLPGFDLVYDLDLSDVVGDRVWIKITPPAGYWLIDRLALDYSPDASLEPIEIAAEAVEGPDGPEVLAAISTEDSHTLRLEPGDPPARVTFSLPAPKEGMIRTVFIRTVNCYETSGVKEKKEGSK